MLAAPLPDPARPARNRIPAIIGATPGVLIVVANGESPRRSTLATGDLGMPEARALLGVPVDRAEQGVDVDERLLGDAGQQIGALGQVDQVCP